MLQILLCSLLEQWFSTGQSSLKIGLQSVLVSLLTTWNNMVNAKKNAPVLVLCWVAIWVLNKIQSRITVLETKVCFDDLCIMDFKQDQNFISRMEM